MLNKKHIIFFILSILFYFSTFVPYSIASTGDMTTYTGIGAYPSAIAFDGTNMWTANGSNHSVTKISPTGVMTNYSGTGDRPLSIAFDGTNMWTADYFGNSVTKISPTGTMTIYSLGLGPDAIAFDGTNMWTADGNDNSVTKISPTGVTTTYAGTGSGPDAIAFDGTNMWTANDGDNSVTKISPTGVMTTYTGTGTYPAGIAFDGTNMWTANESNNTVTKVSPAGVMTTYTGVGNFPCAIAFDGTNMWTADKYNNGSTEITPSGVMSVFSGTGSYPTAIAFDGTNMWTADYYGNSVTKIITGIVPTVSASISANGLLGQPDYTTSSPYGGQGSTNALGYGGGAKPWVSDALDTVNHRLFVADLGSDRILVYQLDSTNNIISTTPQNVLGSCDLSSAGSGSGQAGFSFANITYDSVNSRLFVSDGFNNRVLAFNVATSSIHNCENATFVLGQPDFNTYSRGSGQNGFFHNDDIDYDGVNSRLFVSDEEDRRVMVFSVPGNATSSINGENAIFELGQPDFNTTVLTRSQSILGFTTGEAYDPVNNRIFVSDFEGSRIMAFNVPGNADSSINGENATFELCQSDFNVYSPAVTQSTCNEPDDLGYDAIGNRLFVGDTINNRILVFSIPGNATSAINGENAQGVIGQGNWTGHTSGLSQIRGNWLDSNHAYDAVNNRAYIEDNNNSRILEFSMVHITTSSFPTGTVDTSYSQPIAINSNQGNSQTYSVYSGSLPVGLTLDSSTGIISGTPTTAVTTTATIEVDDNFNAGLFFDRSAYTFHINSNLSSDATLGNLTTSSGILSPTFSSSTSTYTENVTNDITSVTITGTVNQINATVKINGASVSYGSASNPISLNVGDNVINVVITAQDGTTTETYTITVTRAVPPYVAPTPNIASHGGHPPLPLPVVTILPITTTPPIISSTHVAPTVSSKQIYNFGNVTLKLGSKGNSVKELQKYLNDTMKLNLKVDGLLGKSTIAYIKEWQKKNGLTADGIVGAKTKEKMNAKIK